MKAVFHGSVTKIQKMTGFSRTTITNALQHDTTGKKADKVRRIYNTHFEPIFKVGVNK